MNAPQRLQKIFERELERLEQLSEKAALDIADLVKLEKLVSAYSKYTPQNFDEADPLAEVSTEELKRRLTNDYNPTREASTEAREAGDVEEG